MFNDGFKIRYLTTLDDFKLNMYPGSPLMKRIKEHRDVAGCVDCSRFVIYYEGPYRYHIMPKIPSCPTGINIVKQFFQFRFQQKGFHFPRESKLMPGAHSLPTGGKHSA
jgi:hypothetical protein